MEESGVSEPKGDCASLEKKDLAQIRRSLPVCTKVCYALGGAPYQLTGNAIGFFLQIFLLDVVQLSPFHASLILFLGRAWDAVSDPAICFLVSGSPQRKLGKLMPWTVASTPFGVVCYFCLWCSPSNSTSVMLKFLWFLAMYCFFQTCMSCYHIPYTSLTMFLGGTQTDRDSATAYRMAVEATSTLIGATIQGQIVGRYHASMSDVCGAQNNSLLNGNFSNRTMLKSTTSLTDTLENVQWAYMVAAIAIGGLYCLSSLVLCLGVKEQPDVLSPKQKSQLPFFSSLRVVLGHAPYTYLLMGFFSASIALQVAACLAIPFWQYFLVKFGKKTIVITGLSCFIPPLVVIALVTNNFLVFAFMVALLGISVAVIYLLPWSMLPDAVDDFKLKHPDCPNMEAFFYSFYVFFNKFAGGLSLGTSTLSLHFAGYKAGDCSHNQAVVTVLRVLMGPVPIAMLLLSITIFCCYPINEETRKHLRIKLETVSQVNEE